MRSLRSEQAPPDNAEMETRIKALEAFQPEARDRLVRLKTRLEDVLQKMASADGVRAVISEARNQPRMWVVRALFIARLLPTLTKKFSVQFVSSQT